MVQIKDEVRHLAFIDALRGIAFLSVLACHSSAAVGIFPGRSLTLNGGYGVQLFFIISAVTLCFSAAERVRRESHPWLYFYIRRFFRIAPLFWLAMVFYWTVPGICGDALRTDFFSWTYPLDKGAVAVVYPHPGQFILSILFLNTWYPFIFDSVVPGGWSISTEMNFYLIFPVLFLCINSFRRSLLVCLAGFILSPWIVHFTDVVSTHLYGQGNLENSQYAFSRDRWLPASLPVFCTGICVYHILRSKYAVMLNQNRFATVYLFVFLMVILGRLLALHSDYMSVIMVVAAGVVVLASPLFPWVVNLLSCNLGKISYSCYIVHFYMLKVAQYVLQLDLKAIAVTNDASGAITNNMIDFFLLFFLTLLLTVIVSTVTYHLVEKPGIAIGRGIIREVERRSIVKRAVLGIDTKSAG